jgi:hypothetical protein
MGLFKSIKKAFKKVTRGIKKVVKGVVKGVKKVVKKISSSKILKALAIAAAVVVTGGAAIGAFGGTAASSTFGSWMVGASNAITGFTVAGIPVGAVMKPFQYVGAAIGSTAGKLTDLTGITTEAGRTGITVTAPAAPGAVPTVSNTTVTAQAAPGAVPGVTETVVTPGTAGTGARTVGTQLNASNTITAKGTAATTPYVSTPLSDPIVATATKAPGSIAPITNTVVTPTEAASTFATRNPKTAAFLKGAGTVATQVGTSVAAGYAMHQLTAPDETGSMGGLRTEGASSFDPLRVYAAERGIADSDISKYFTFGNTAEAGNMPLFQQQTIGVA